jgi:hypothetical protein
MPTSPAYAFTSTLTHHTWPHVYTQYCSTVVFHLLIYDFTQSDHGAKCVHVQFIDGLMPRIVRWECRCSYKGRLTVISTYRTLVKISRVWLSHSITTQVRFIYIYIYIHTYINLTWWNTSCCVQFNRWKMLCSQANTTLYIYIVCLRTYKFYSMYVYLHTYTYILYIYLFSCL